MIEEPRPSPEEDLRRIIESARRLGVEMDEGEALTWLSAMAAGDQGIEVGVDMDTGVYGNRVSMLDFTSKELTRFREIAAIVEIPDRPGVVETAIALSGSAAQSKIQSYPGDCDYFERVNIRTPSRQEASRILSEVIREKALATASGPTFRLTEVRFGSYPHDIVRNGISERAGGPVSWSPAEVEAGRFAAERSDGTAVEITWEDVSGEPGWCKLDWIVADPVRGDVANASNMLDATWEAPDGTIEPLDGFLDPYFQEVYLEAESIPIFSKIARGVLPDAIDDYVDQLEREVHKYVTEPVNYGKAAKRLYNVFRLTGRHAEAAYLRELFDEPTTILYRVAARIRALDEAASGESEISPNLVASEVDELIAEVEGAAEGDVEARVLAHLREVRESVVAGEGAESRTDDVRGAREAVEQLVNEFFRERLTSIPEIAAYLARLSGS